MARFVLISGAWHGAWCWEYVIPALEALGHRARAVELPGMGASPVPLATVGMTDWVDAAADVVDSEAEPVILVGHSRGGVVVSQVAERLPERIALSVYLTAILLSDGEAALDAGSLGGGGQTREEFEPMPDGIAFPAPIETIDQAYARSSAELRERAIAHLTPEPSFALLSPLSLSADRYGRVPRAYVECLADAVVPLTLQRVMQSRQPCDPVVAIDADHCPTYSAPGLVAATLDDLARNAGRSAAAGTLSPETTA